MPALRTICFDGCQMLSCETVALMQFWLSLIDKCPHVTTIVIRNEPFGIVPSSYDVFVQLVRDYFSHFCELQEISLESSNLPQIATAFKEFSEELLESLGTCKQLRRIRLGGTPSDYHVHDRFVRELPNVSFTY